MESAAFVFERKENRKEKACSGNKLQHVSYLPKSLSMDKKKKEIDFSTLATLCSIFPGRRECQEPGSVPKRSIYLWVKNDAIDPTKLSN